ncbi:MAG TPA: sulfur transferase domain-containing protein [Planctomycetota bacterium]
MQRAALAGIVLLLGFATACAGPRQSDLSSQGLNRGPLLPPTPVEGWEFLATAADAGNGVWVAGQPSAADLRRFAADGGSLVVCLRTPEEMDDRARVPFDEAALVGELGMEYLHLPLGGDDYPYTPDAVEALAEALALHDGRALLHCTVAWRASHLWTAYLVRYQGMPLSDAWEWGLAINLGELPVEGLLGGRLSPRIVPVAAEPLGTDTP